MKTTRLIIAVLFITSFSTSFFAQKKDTSKGSTTEKAAPGAKKSKVKASDAITTVDEFKDVVIENIGEEINSTSAEYAPVISADGSLLIFTTKRPTYKKQKEKELLEQIWMSEKDEKSGKWTKASPLAEVINHPKKNISNIAISNDGQRMLVYVDELDGTGNVYESTLSGINWSKPEKLPVPISSPDHESSATYSPDGNTIYFVSDRQGGIGGLDIWFAKKDKKGSWPKVATNLGPIVNSVEDEESIFIHPDGKTLYFSSKREGGLGGYDIYKTELVKKKWTVPVNIGEPVNTSGDDLFFVMEASGQVAYYASNQKGTLGDKDIFRISIQNKNVEEGPKLALLKGTITDEKTAAPLEADIELIDNEKGEVIGKFKSNNISGKYLISLPSGKNYGINIVAPGYLFQSVNVNFPDTSSYIEIIKDIQLKKIELGTRIVLNNIFFDYAKSTIRPESHSELEKLAKILKENPTLKVEISGHTDNKGNAAYNQQLSQDRAKAVVDYLVTQAIPMDRLTFKGYGLEQPIATNDTEAGRQLNRRTEFKITAK